MAALNAISLGVAIFNERLSCVTARVALDSVNLAPAKGGLRQTLQDIFGGEASQISQRSRVYGGQLIPFSGLSAALSARQMPLTSHWSAILYPVTDASGRVRFVAMILSDVSARDNLQQRLRRIANRAQFLGGLIRTPDNEMTDLFEC
jgi:hypothetical protein